MKIKPILGEQCDNNEDEVEVTVKRVCATGLNNDIGDKEMNDVLSKVMEIVGQGGNI